MAIHHPLGACPPETGGDSHATRAWGLDEQHVDGFASAARRPSPSWRRIPGDLFADRVDRIERLIGSWKTMAISLLGISRMS